MSAGLIAGLPVQIPHRASSSPQIIPLGLGSWVSPFLLRFLLRKKPVQLGWPLQSLLRPKAVLVIQPPAPVPQPRVSISILNWPLFMSSKKNPLPQKPVSILGFPGTPLQSWKEGFVSHTSKTFVKCHSVFSQLREPIVTWAPLMSNLHLPRLSAAGSCLPASLRPHCSCCIKGSRCPLPAWAQKPASALKEPPKQFSAKQSFPSWSPCQLLPADAVGSQLSLHPAPAWPGSALGTRAGCGRGLGGLGPTSRTRRKRGRNPGFSSP